MTQKYDGLLDAVSELASAVARVHDAQLKTSEVVSGILQQLAEGIDLRAGSRQDGVITQALLMSLIGALAKSGAVDGSAVAERLRSAAQSLHHALDGPHRILASRLADELSHPGFPDNVPPGRGHTPTLIVDND